MMIMAMAIYNNNENKQINDKKAMQTITVNMVITTITITKIITVPEIKITNLIIQLGYKFNLQQHS